MTHPPRDTPLDGEGLREAFAAASRHLRESAKAVDAINVYPVPDGDTGSNMAATLREAVDHAERIEGDPTVPAVLAALAKGSLYGGRGNSGVILSQALRGLSAGVGDTLRLDAAALARGLAAGAEAAYAAVINPVEGTMLTVLRAAGDAATSAAASLPARGHGYPCASTLAAAIRAAEEAEARTPEQLPALAEAGVTDAGGEGVCVILRGLLAYITGEAPPLPALPERPIAVRPEHEREEFGFCTEFVLETDEAPLDVDAVRGLVAGGGNRSVVVVGDARALRIHAHSDNPDALVAAARAVGRVSRTKVEDMSAQHERFGETGTGATPGVAILALSPGPGFDAILESLGVATMRLGDVVKPPAGEIAEAADRLRKADVIVVPNHKNVILAARQAADLAAATIHVVPATTVPEGIAAALAFDPTESAAANAAAMDAALASVRTVEVTIAAATRMADGVTAHEGEAIALVDDRLVASRETVDEALLDGLAAADAESAALVTLYAGADLSPADLQRIAASVRERYPTIEVETLEGGQPLYPIIASVES